MAFGPYSKTAGTTWAGTAGQQFFGFAVPWLVGLGFGSVLGGVGITPERIESFSKLFALAFPGIGIALNGTLMPMLEGYAKGESEVNRDKFVVAFIEAVRRYEASEPAESGSGAASGRSLSADSHAVGLSAGEAKSSAASGASAPRLSGSEGDGMDAELLTAAERGEALSEQDPTALIATARAIFDRKRDLSKEEVNILSQMMDKSPAVIEAEFTQVQALCCGGSGCAGDASAGAVLQQVAYYAVMTLVAGGLSALALTLSPTAITGSALLSNLVGSAAGRVGVLAFESGAVASVLGACSRTSEAELDATAFVTF